MTAFTPAEHDLLAVAELTSALQRADATLREQLATLRQTEQRTQAILDAVPDAIIGLDDAGRITLVNPAAISVFGNDPLVPSVPGGPVMALTEWLPELDAAGIDQHMAEGLALPERDMQVARFEALARRHDGTEFSADVSLSRVQTPGGPSTTCVVRDITEQREAFSMLTLYRRALDCTGNGVVISDLTVPGRPVRYANPAFTRITGYADHEALGRSLGFLAGDDTAQPAIERMADSLMRGDSDSAVVRHYRKDGTPFFDEMSVAPVISPDGDIDHSVSVLNDVTERERSRLALAERSDRLNAVFDLSPDGYLVFDADQRLVVSNRAFQVMTGWWTASDAEPLPLEAFDRQFAALCDPDRPARSLAEVMATADGVADTVVLLRPERRVLSRSVRSQQSGAGETIVFLRDVTRETEVDRMKSEFLTTAAHELRTPMVSVFGFAELLLNRPVPEPRRRDMIETIHRQSKLLINMVNELLDLARIEAHHGDDLKREPCRLGTLVQQAVEPFAAHHGADRLGVSLDHAEAVVHMDAEKTLRTLTNVLSNAFKYSPDGGAILIDTLEGQLGERPAVGVRITDHGMGMTPEQCERVFERFYRADPSGHIPGTGLGMSLVKEITELHGGRVDLCSVPGAGTEVTLWWPVDPASLATGEPGALDQGT